jgi:hypothetical protein
MSRSVVGNNHPEFLSCPFLSGDRVFSRSNAGWQEDATISIS